VKIVGLAVENRLGWTGIWSKASAALRRAVGTFEGESSFYMGLAGSWVGRMPKRFLMVTRCLENLSSGEKRAGCADLVITPSTVFLLSV
jgi:hypothetical protein